MNFVIRFKSKTIDQIRLHFASKTKASLKIRDIKFYYTSHDCHTYLENYIKIELDNSWEEKVFFLMDKLYKPVTQYRRMTFIVKDSIAKEQYAVSVSLNNEEVAFRKMVYEGQKS